MTREESIDRLRKISEKTPIRTNGDDLLAITMAIQALSQEPTTTTNNNEPITMIYPTIVCDDAISRQAVFDLMRSLTRWCVRSEDGKFNNVGLLYDDVMFGIDKLPSVNPQKNIVNNGTMNITL